MTAATVGWVTACTSGTCLEVKHLTCDVVAIRDSGGGPTITIGRDSWTAFLAGVKAGVFDEVTP